MCHDIYLNMLIAYMSIRWSNFDPHKSVVVYWTLLPESISNEFVNLFYQCTKYDDYIEIKNKRFKKIITCMIMLNGFYWFFIENKI